MTNEPQHQEVADDDHEPATKGDVRSAVSELRTEMNTKFDAVAELIKDTNRRMQKQAEETRRHFDVVAENIHRDVAGANQDKVQLLEDKQDDHEERIARIEKTVGVR